MSKLYLNIPFNCEEDLESYGCYFDKNENKWCYEGKKENYLKLGRFFLKKYEDGDFEENKGILCDNLYILESDFLCSKCGKKIKVITLGGENFIEYYTKTESINGIEQNIWSDELHLIDLSLNELPQYILNFIKAKYNIDIVDEKLINKCQFCNQKLILDDYSCNNPFDIIFDIKKLKNIKIYKIPLKFDIIFSYLLFKWSNIDYLYLEKCKIIEIVL